MLGPSTLSWAAVLACLSRPLLAFEDASGNPVTVVGQGVPVDVPSTYYTRLHRCPKSCSVKRDPLAWTVYPTLEKLQNCDQPMLASFAVFSPLDDPKTSLLLRACSLGREGNSTEDKTASGTSAATSKPAVRPVLRRGDAASSTCLQTGKSSAVDFELLNDGSGTPNTGAGEGLLAVLKGMQTAFEDDVFCDQSVLFGYANGAAVGVHLANMFGKGTLVSVLERLQDEVRDGSHPTGLTTQLCRNASQEGAVGVSISTVPGLQGLAAVQRDVMSWAQGNCVSREAPGKGLLKGVRIWANTDGAAMGPTVQSNTTTHPHAARRAGSSRHQLERRGDCRTISVVDRDSCGSLATKCGISPSDFMKYNPAPNLCSTLQINQKVCCSEGTIPTPKQNANGTCFTYLVQPGDTCSSLALSNGLQPADIQKFNVGKTWGWTNCGSIQHGVNICLSDGTPPLPAPYDNAICGPVKPGTTYPTKGTNISEMNPCPLNACCDNWGQCGITPEFCTIYKSPTGNPGYHPPNAAACINNCGQEITNKDAAPAAFGRVGYFEAWNFDRPCVNLQAQHANTDGSYTHIHWAFGYIDNLVPKVNDTYKQWDDFLGLRQVQRIVSFGGWGYSTDPATYDILRQAMAPANRDAFSTNVVNFLNENKLDGVDFDWEYPGAPDIPGIPPGQADDGPNYLKFLSTLRSKMPPGKTLSIAAPASFWYLKAFPIEKMASVLDYIVFMTYDLHGQWDYGNNNSVDGCDGGNCLRSHVNLTETMQVLAMITKAGVPTNKIYVGEASYGRSFGMADPSCSGPMCRFTGGYDQSTAQPGTCTQTAGYISNAEIYSLLDLADNATTWYDTDSNSNIMTWDNGNWVAFMSDDTRHSRRDFWKGFNFAGTIDWAVDLQSFGDEGDPDDLDGLDEDYLPPGDLGWGPCPDRTYATLEDIDNDTSIPFYCSALYVLQFLQSNLTASMTSYDDLIHHGYDDKFNTYADAVVEGSSQVVDDFMRQNGNKYFTCVVTEMQLCCDKCKVLAPGFPGACTYCFDGDCCKSGVREARNLDLRDRPPPSQCGVLGSIHDEFKNVSEPCPPDYSKRGLGQGQPISDTVYWTLDPAKSDQFYADLYNATGISPDNIALKDINHSECAPSDSFDECRHHSWDIGIPAPNGYDRSDVLNPKDTVAKAYSNLENLKGSEFSDVIAQVQTGQYGGSPQDLVDALALPIFMISDAIDGMNQVVKVADEINHEKMMAIIFGFLSAILFFVPVAGEIAGEVAALAGISRIAALIGAAGNAAMDIYQIVDEKGNAPLAIFGLITGPLAIADVAAIAKAAGLRRGMSAEEVEGLGKVKPKLDLVDRIKAKGVCPLPKKKRDDIPLLGDGHGYADLEALSHLALPGNGMLVSDRTGRSRGMTGF